jgi:hypothetical protein
MQADRASAARDGEHTVAARRQWLRGCGRCELLTRARQAGVSGNTISTCERS